MVKTIVRQGSGIKALGALVSFADRHGLHAIVRNENDAKTHRVSRLYDGFVQPATRFNKETNETEIVLLKSATPTRFHAGTIDELVDTMDKYAAESGLPISHYAFWEPMGTRAGAILALVASKNKWGSPTVMFGDPNWVPAKGATVKRVSKYEVKPIS